MLYMLITFSSFPFFLLFFFYLASSDPPSYPPSLASLCPPTPPPAHFHHASFPMTSPALINLSSTTDPPGTDPSQVSLSPVATPRLSSCTPPNVILLYPTPPPQHVCSRTHSTLPPPSHFSLITLPVASPHLRLLPSLCYFFQARRLYAPPPPLPLQSL